MKYYIQTVIMMMLLSGCPCFSKSFYPLSLGDAANSSRIDGQPMDQKGGWLDLGSNDLHVLPSGEQKFSKIPFAIPEAKSEADKNCIVLGLTKDSPDDAEIKGLSVAGQYLYILHAAANCPKSQDRVMVGEIKIEYEDDSEREFHIRSGRDVADWTSSKSYSNAARVWTEYNHNTQVSLFLSKFHLDPAKKVKEIEFESEDDHTWMIIGATIGQREKIKPLFAKLELNNTYKAPAPLQQKLERVAPGQYPKNIIYIIGDGMGQGAVKLASLYQHKKDHSMFFCQMPIVTLCSTFSANSDVTDSAASGTAFATGYKTFNGTLGYEILNHSMLKKPRLVTSYAKLAHDQGRSIALITSDLITSATPAAFYAHVMGRGETQKIVDQLAETNYEILIGRQSKGTQYFLPPSEKGHRKDQRNILSEMEKNGYQVIYTQKQLDATPADKKIIGFMESLESVDGLGKVVTTSVDRLSKNPKGFFMMAETYLTDAGGHGNNPECTVRGVIQVDWMFRAALDFALRNKDTLIIVTADHETGGIQSTMSGLPFQKIVVNYTCTSHTGAPVALYAYGPGSELFEGFIDNTDIAKILIRLMKLNK